MAVAAATTTTKSHGGGKGGLCDFRVQSVDEVKAAVLFDFTCALVTSWISKERNKREKKAGRRQSRKLGSLMVMISAPCYTHTHTLTHTEWS